MPKGYDQLTDSLLAFVAQLGASGFVLMKLKRYEFGYTKYGNSWPSQKRMAMEIGMSLRTFVAAIAKLQKHGYVQVEKKTEGGKVKTYYVISIPVSDVPEGVDEVDLELSDAERVEAELDPAPVEPIKGNKSVKEQLFAQFVKTCAPALNPMSARKAFMKLAHAKAVIAVDRVGVYTTIFNAAPNDKKRYFKHINSWLESGEFEADESVWRQRAGITLRASSSKQHYGQKAKERRQIV
ncbi:MAG: helix-turn-helix domain-containing protein [Planctomycetes bacterium]|nr:helix-turn-helix domain-containing protein [Planctomycetota bacterium]